MARGPEEPRPLPYLSDAMDQDAGGLDLVVEAYLSTAAMRAGGLGEVRLSTGSTRDLWWTPAQLLAHHTVGGCNLEAGDLLGTGTISGAEAAAGGSLLELTEGGTRPIPLPTGETRTFLEAGDRLRLSARGRRAGFASIGFGSCIGEILG
jgi:fumarylacetoacetase